VPITRDYMAEWKAAHPLVPVMPIRKVGAGD